MTPRHAHRGKRSALGALALSAGALFAASPATADPTDDGFVAALRKNGIVINDPATAVALAHGVCAGFDKGETPRFVAMSLIKDTNLSPEKSGFFMVVAVADYCPNHQGALASS
ncbi:DUF732 domain-containing protein [Mycobacterium parmense]|uniref:Uncharacterized protein n=1 Tax=Mycobacterium parmense TaxID=185642 RepID=A0A7I7YT25_9MYCO|nr:DUF732 domain-containing protein [Mycobacterium parmense]MCV7348784.1 DUF732 domain-containing protein [Mycobacterium parmense]ORW49652.1 hypothetical protein AWC20_03425 [Mycobacterium parmense]BBZ44294.1 hypothetical protein MPRM_15750 [Mycobacterium parmense]